MSLVFEEIPSLIHCELQPKNLHGLAGSICIDTRVLEPGKIFIALKAEQADGHDFVEAAFKKGAQAAIVHQDWYADHHQHFKGKAFIIVEDSLLALQRLASKHRRRFRCPVIGLTGSNGKTSTKELLAAALSLRFKTLKSPGNFNNHLGVPLTLLEMKPETEVVVLEMGTNQPGDMEKLCEITHPDYGLALNVGPTHLERLGDLEGVAEEKGRLLQSLARNGAAFINCDDPYVCSMPTTANHRFCFGFNADVPEADCEKMICGVNPGVDAEGYGHFRLRGVPFRLNWFGMHQVSNALAAAAVADFFGVSLQRIALAFTKMPALPGRLKVEKIAGLILVDDAYNANLASTTSALAYFEKLEVTGRKFVVLGDHLELGATSKDQHQKIGELLSQKQIDGVFLIGPEMQHARTVAADKALHYQADFSDLTPVIKTLEQTLQKGDAVLVKASRGIGLDRIVNHLRSIANRARS